MTRRQGGALLVATGVAAACLAVALVLWWHRSLAMEEVLVEEERTSDPAVVWPAPRFLDGDRTMVRIEHFQAAVRSGQRLSVVRFLTEAQDSTNPSAVAGSPPSASATQVAYLDISDPSRAELQVHGSFSEIRDLQNGFKDLGPVHGSVAVDLTHGGDSAMRRVEVLLKAQPHEPLLLLATSTNRSTSILDAELSGPLSEKDSDSLAELVPALAQGDGETSVALCEEWLRSTSPWFARLGLLRLRAQNALTAAHFRTVIESRPLAETEGLFKSMLWEAACTPRLRSTMMQELKVLFQLSEKQVPLLRWMATDLKNNPVDIGRTIDPAELRRWLDDYRVRLEPGTPQEVTEALGALRTVLDIPLPPAPPPAPPPPPIAPGTPSSIPPVSGVPPSP